LLSRRTNISPLPHIAPAAIEAKPEHVIHRVEHERRPRKGSTEREARDSKMTEMWNRGEPVDVSIRQIAKACRISRPAASRNLDTLCILGWMRRKRGEADRRDVFAILTDEGRRMALAA
jgi:MarR family